jgi:hypothetical protein
VRVLNLSKGTTLVAEWAPPATRSSRPAFSDPRTKQSPSEQKIAHASLCTEGGVLATFNTLYSVTFGKDGRVQISSTNMRENEVCSHENMPQVLASS